MKVFALGGYGKTGIPAIKLLAQSDMVTQIAIAGRNLEHAEKVAAEIGEKTVAVEADGIDEEKLTSCLAGYDILMNAATNEAVLPAIRAAIHNGAHYCDMAAGPILEQALKLSSEAKTAGITSIIANGIHPSNTNLMGVHVARQLDEVEQLQLGEASIYHFQTVRELTPRQWLGDPKESLTPLYDYKYFLGMMMQMVQKNGIRTVLDYQDGRWVEVDPVRNGLEIPLPQGGTMTAYPYASSDPLFGSLPSNISSVSPVEMFFSAFPPQLHDLLRELALRVLGGEIDSEAAVSTFYETIERDPCRWLTLPDDFVAPAKLWARAVGRKEGRAARHNCWLTPDAWDVGGYFLTSAALVVAALMILSGEIQERGVLHAETVFDPLPFFDKVAVLVPAALPDGKLINESFEWLE